MRHYGPCLCGATDCPSCGPAQGYEVIRRWNPLTQRYQYVNPDEGAVDEDVDPDNPDEDSTVEDREPDYEHREVYEPIEAEWARWRDE